MLFGKNLVCLFLKLTNGLHLVVNPLYSRWWSLLLIVDFDTHTPTSWRVFLIWPTVVKGFVFTREIILLSSTTVVFRGLLGLLVLLSSPVHSFFLRKSAVKAHLVCSCLILITIPNIVWYYFLAVQCADQWIIKCIGALLFLQSSSQLYSKDIQGVLVLILLLNNYFFLKFFLKNLWHAGYTTKCGVRKTLLTVQFSELKIINWTMTLMIWSDEHG